MKIGCKYQIMSMFQNRNSEKWEQYICGLIMPNNIYGVMGLMAGIKDPFKLGKTKSYRMIVIW
jgi:hypothetical protein